MRAETEIRAVKKAAEKVVKDIRRATRRQFSTEKDMNEQHDPSVLNSVKRIVNTTKEFVAAHARI